MGYSELHTGEWKEIKSMTNNIFREARQLLRDKPVSEMNEEELHIVNAAAIPLNILPEFNDMTIDEGLEKLSKIFQETVGEEEK